MLNELFRARNHIRADFAMRAPEFSQALLNIRSHIMNEQNAQGSPSVCRPMQDRSKDKFLGVILRGYTHRMPGRIGGIVPPLLAPIVAKASPFGTVIQCASMELSKTAHSRISEGYCLRT